MHFPITNYASSSRDDYAPLGRSPTSSTSTSAVYLDYCSLVGRYVIMLLLEKVDWDHGCYIKWLDFWKLTKREAILSSCLISTFIYVLKILNSNSFASSASKTIRLYADSNTFIAAIWFSMIDYVPFDRPPHSSLDTSISIARILSYSHAYLRSDDLNHHSFSLYSPNHPLIDYYPSPICYLRMIIMKFWIDISHLFHAAIYSNFRNFTAYTSTAAFPIALIIDKYFHS